LLYIIAAITLSLRHFQVKYVFCEHPLVSSIIPILCPQLCIWYNPKVLLCT